MIQHEEFVNFSGSEERAISTALGTLLPLGFQVESQGSAHLFVTNNRYRSAQDSPLLGISRAEFNFSRFTLNVKAELGGVEKIRRFLLFVLLGSCVFDAVLFTALWFFIEDLHIKTWLLVFPLVILLPWVFIGPYMSRWLKNRTVDALKALLDEMAA